MIAALFKWLRREPEKTGGTGQVGKPYSCLDCACVPADLTDGLCWRCRVQRAQGDPELQEIIVRDAHHRGLI